MPVSRRQFLATSAATGIAGLAAPVVRAASDRKTFRTALIGTGWWGMNILREAIASGRTKVVALCDVDANALEASADQLSDLTADEPKTYGDFRELLDQQQIDIAIVATPDHWHALNTIEAIKAGAHVFVEKPTGHTILESRAMLNAARAENRVVQVGLHRRMGPHYQSAMKFLRDGHLGDIGMVRAFVHGGGGTESARPNSDPPQGMDWDMYCGPAPLRPFNRMIHPGGFRNFLDFANGTLGDWGVHWLDQILWWSDEKYPREVHSSGGRFVRGAPILNETEQTSDAPDTQVAVYQFDSFVATWEHRRYAENPTEKHRIGCYYYGTNGALHVGWRDGWTFYPAKDGPVVHEKAQHAEPDGHSVKELWADFLTSIDSGRRPACDIEVGHYSTNLSLLGMLSLKLGRSITWDGANERAVNDPEANALLRRDYRGSWVYPKS